ncbi:MAG: cysteine hydrolase [Desulfobulbaceae bacterium]|nr:cysteine hydrolase [Desulfobulbaceae bacterium]
MKKALVIIDMQNDYFPGGKMELVGIREAAANAGLLLAMFRARDQPIFHIQHLATSPGAAFFVPDTDGVKIHSSVAPQEGESVIEKHYPNSFRETVLLEELQSLGIQELVVCGAMSHMCIDTTVRAGFDLGLSCVVVADGCATKDLAYGDQVIPAVQVQGAYMASLGAVFAKVTELSGLEAILQPTS